MKKFFFAFLLLVVSSTVPILLALAKSTPPPTVDTPLSPVDGPKAILTGTADPNAKIIVTGGLYEIAPGEADSDGNFSITVALIQESTNRFYVQAENSKALPSEAVEIVIVESAAETAAYEAETGEDRSAPDGPVIAESTIETDESRYTIEGTGESGAHVYINSADSGEEVDSDGNFSVEVSLSGEGVKDTFSISLLDDAGNLSSGVKVYITSVAGASTETGAEDSAEEKEDLTDIQGHWAEDYILELYNADVVSGYGNGRFGPDDSLTRAQIVKIALLAFELPYGDLEDAGFSDLDDDDWFYDYVNAAAGDLDIVKGYSDNTFKPNNSVTRAEALKIILLAGGISDFDSVTPNFSDVDTVNDWFAKYSAYAKDAGLLSGYSDGSFRGNQSITRAEACKIVVELLELLEG